MSALFFRKRPTAGPRTAEVKPTLTTSALERSALWHLGRRALTTAELRTRLLKKAARHPLHAESAAWIDALVLRLASSLILDDARVAHGRVESARARGWSRRRIEQKLRGVDVDVTDAAFAIVDDAAAFEADLAAAVIYTQRKKLAAKEPHKALAALARQGFSFSVSKAALTAAS